MAHNYKIPVSKITDDVNQMPLPTKSRASNVCYLRKHGIGRIVRPVFPTVKEANIPVTSVDRARKRESVYSYILVCGLLNQLQNFLAGMMIKIFSCTDV